MSQHHMAAIVQQPQKRRIARHFGRKSRTYESHALFQRQLLMALAPRIQKVASPRDCWVDLGSGSGILQKINASQSGLPRFICLDIARECLQLLRETKSLVASRSTVQADIESLPFIKQCFDGAVCASVLQWVHRPQAALTGIQTALKPGACLVFAVYTEGSLEELSQIRAAMGLTIPFGRFTDATFAAALRKAGFDLTESADMADTHYFTKAIDALRDISACGATATAGKRLSRAELIRFCSAYEDRFGCAKGVPVSYRAMVGTALNTGRQQT
jgi:malonyl-ACP O-methyltransferase BioC